MKVLVVGGTGMLWGTCLGLRETGHEVYALARNTHHHYPGIHPVVVNYKDLVQLEAALEPLEPFDMAVVWIHSDAPQTPYVVAKYVDGPYYHVLSSQAGEPSELVNPRRRQHFEGVGTDYREIILGFVAEQWGSRWLEHEEIATGVLQAIGQNARQFVVGTVKPWSARPK
jgi:hypothetical protein